MVDIATVSVVASAAVALGTVAANFIGGERQRKHEADLDFERRVWEQKSEALFEVMRVCRSMSDELKTPTTDDNRQSRALYLSQRLDALNKVRPTVDAFASTRCSEDLAGLVDAMTTGGIKPYLGERNWRLMREIVKTDVDDHAAWKRNKEQRDQLKAEAVADFNPDVADLRKRAKDLLMVARDSVRRPKD